MKKTTLITSFIVLCTIANAQSFVKGQKDINIGIGFGTSFYSSTYNSTIPPLSFSFDVGITDEISLGGYLGFAGASWRYTSTEWCNIPGSGGPNFYNYTDEYNYTYNIVAMRGAYHFAEFIPHDNLDVYGGLLLGYNIVRYKFSTTSACAGHISSSGSGSAGVFSIYGGMRYRFNEKFGIFAELGYGISYVTIGLSIKM